MDDTSPAHERASVTVARWALGGATAALVALASGATALLVVTSTTSVGLPVESPHPLPGTEGDGFGGSADVLLLPGGSRAASGTRAARADTGSDDLLLVLRSTGSRTTPTLTGQAARRAPEGAAPPVTGPAAPAADDVQVLPDVQDRPEAEQPEAEQPEAEKPEPDDGPASERPRRPGRPTPAPGRTTPPAQEEPEDDESTQDPGRPTTEPRDDAPDEDDEDGGPSDEDEKDKREKDEKDKRDKREKDEAPADRGAGGGAAPGHAGPPAGAGRPAGTGYPGGR